MTSHCYDKIAKVEAAQKTGVSNPRAINSPFRRLVKRVLKGYVDIIFMMAAQSTRTENFFLHDEVKAVSTEKRKNERGPIKWGNS